MSEIELLRALEVAVGQLRPTATSAAVEHAWRDLAAFRAAAKPEPEGETVEVRGVLARFSNNTLELYGRSRDGGKTWSDTISHSAAPIATIIARVPLPVVPTIKAEVEAP